MSSSSPERYELEVGAREKSDKAVLCEVYYTAREGEVMELLSHDKPPELHGEPVKYRHVIEESETGQPKVIKGIGLYKEGEREARETIVRYAVDEPSFFARAVARVIGKRAETKISVRVEEPFPGEIEEIRGEFSG